MRCNTAYVTTHKTTLQTPEGEGAKASGARRREDGSPQGRDADACVKARFRQPSPLGARTKQQPKDPTHFPGEYLANA